MEPKNKKAELPNSGNEEKLFGMSFLTEDEIHDNCIDRYADFMKYAPTSFIKKLRDDPKIFDRLVKKIEEKVLEQKNKEEKATKTEVILPSHVYYG